MILSWIHLAFLFLKSVTYQATFVTKSLLPLEMFLPLYIL